MDALYRALGAAGGFAFEPSAVFVAPRVPKAEPQVSDAGGGQRRGARVADRDRVVASGTFEDERPGGSTTRPAASAAGRRSPSSRRPRAGRRRRRVRAQAVAHGDTAGSAPGRGEAGGRTPPAAAPTPAAPVRPRRPLRARAGRDAEAGRGDDAGQRSPKPSRSRRRRRRRGRGTEGRSAAPGDSPAGRSAGRHQAVPDERSFARGFPVEVSAEAAAVHEAALVLDLHNDLLTKLTHMPGYDFSRAHAPATFYNPLRLDLDLPRIRRGGIDALGCLMFAGFRFDKSRNRFWRQLACARGCAERIPTPSRWRARPTTSAPRAPRASWRCSWASRAATRSTTTCRPASRAWPRRASGSSGRCGSATARPGRHAARRPERDHGLTEHGRALVRACNEAGLLLDVAHASRKTFWDMLEASATPPFSSHSGADGVHPHPRNLDDDQIRALAARGGIVGVIFVAAYLGGAVLHARARRRPHRARGARRRRRLRRARLGFRRVHAAAARAARRRRSAAADRAPVAARLARAAAGEAAAAATRSATWRKV